MSDIQIDKKKFKENLAATNAYAKELNKKDKIRAVHVSDEENQKKTLETLAECAYFYKQGVAKNSRAITQHSSFAEFLQDVTEFKIDENFGFNLSLLKACGLNENSTLQEIVDAPKKFSAASTVANQGYRWLIPQIIQAVAYQNSRISPAKHTEWIPNSLNVGDAIEVVKPAVEANDAIPYVANEFQSFTYATVSFSQKTIKFMKLQKGFQLGRKQLRITSIPMLPLMTNAIMAGFDKVMDTLALLALLNGDQADLSEAAKTTGLKTANTPTFKDFMRVKTRSIRLGVDYNKMLTNEATALDVATLPEFLGTTTNTGYKTMLLKMDNQFYPNINSLDTHGAYTDPNSILLFNTGKAAQRLVQRPLVIDNEYDIESEVTTFYARNEFAFMTHDLLARLKMDLSQADETFDPIFNADVLERATPMTW